MVGKTAWRNLQCSPQMLCLKKPHKPQNLCMDPSSRPKGKKGSKISQSVPKCVHLALSSALRKGWLAEGTCSLKGERTRASLMCAPPTMVIKGFMRQRKSQQQKLNMHVPTHCRITVTYRTSTNKVMCNNVLSRLFLSVAD